MQSINTDTGFDFEILVTYIKSKGWQMPALKCFNLSFYYS